MLALPAEVDQALEDRALSIAKTALERFVPGFRANAMRRDPRWIEESFCVTFSTIAQKTDNAAARPRSAHGGRQLKTGDEVRA